MPEEPKPKFDTVPSPREVHWRRVLDRWQASGLDGRAFCRREGLPEPSFYGWKRQIRLRDARASRPPQKPRRVRRSRPMRLLPVKVSPVASPFEVVLPGGRLVRVASDFDAAAFKRLLDVLGAAAC